MTKNERAYMSRLVDEANQEIQSIKDGSYLGGVYKTGAERMAAMQMIAHTIEPIAALIGQEVADF